MPGFFDEKDVVQPDQTAERLSRHVRKKPNCKACRLIEKCGAMVDAHGRNKKCVFLLGEFPLKSEVGGPAFSAQAGQWLEEQLSLFGLDMEEDCVSMYALSCFPPGFRVTKDQISHCRPRVWAALRKAKPDLVLCFGVHAVECMVGHRFAEGIGGIDRWRGFVFPDLEFQCWVGCLWSPVEVLRRLDKSPVLRVIFKQDLSRALGHRERPLPDTKEPQIVLLRKPSEIRSKLRAIIKRKPVLSFDYETTGLKPDAKGHRILTVAFAVSEKTGYAFMFSKETASLWRRILRDPKIKKVAANMKYEHAWGIEILKTRTRGWVFDTMLCQHVLDNRVGITGLDFQAFVRLGVEDYSSSLKDYKKSKDGKSNGKNRLDQFPEDRLLEYNAKDAVYTYRIYKQQRKELKERCQ